MQFRDKQAWDDWKANQTSDYGCAIFRYAEAWATLMEAKMESGSQLEDIAKESSHTADTEGITGFMYGCAVAALAHCWVHGEALRRWHNLDTQIGTEGKEANAAGRILNPAILRIEQ